MTEKKLNILQAALDLFATRGYNATATATIAKQAGVSEGLIFRHFASKQGLLKAIMQQGNQQMMVLIQPILKLNEAPSKTVA